MPEDIKEKLFYMAVTMGFTLLGFLLAKAPEWFGL